MIYLARYDMESCCRLLLTAASEIWPVEAKENLEILNDKEKLSAYVDKKRNHVVPSPTVLDTQTFEDGERFDTFSSNGPMIPQILAIFLLCQRGQMRCVGEHPSTPVSDNISNIIDTTMER